MRTATGTIWGRLNRRRRALGRDERGVTAVEFGLLALPFFTIIAAILQTSLVFLADQVLESAVHDAARAIRTGQAQEAGFTIDNFRADVCGRLYGLFSDCGGLHVRVSEIGTFRAASVAVPVEEECEGPCEWSIPERWTPGEGRSVILVQVFYRYPVPISLGPFGMANLPDGTRLLGSSAVFQNEPFSG
ncbi:TadE/TadG family type IV pilus assembly protein [Devosia honganensis]|uniref:TadE/TadG family type IV pilus assembly protein n=1 Tax=Devosia honganensis TaxID=1610527 RepID=A0ABV7X0M3_9HYPH